MNMDNKQRERLALRLAAELDLSAVQMYDTLGEILKGFGRPIPKAKRKSKGEGALPPRPNGRKGKLKKPMKRAKPKFTQGGRTSRAWWRLADLLGGQAHTKDKIEQTARQTPMGEELLNLNGREWFFRFGWASDRCCDGVNGLVFVREPKEVVGLAIQRINRKGEAATITNVATFLGCSTNTVSRYWPAKGDK